MKVLIVVCLMALVSKEVWGQVKAYRIDKPIITGVDESISIVVDRPGPKIRGTNVGSLLPGLLGNIISTGIDLVKMALSNEEQKYTATYSGSATGNDLMIVSSDTDGIKGILNADSIHIIRTIVHNDMTTEKVCEIVLVPEADKGSGLYRFRVARINMEGSKAKIKKMGKNGKVLDLSIDIKLDAIWKEAVGSSNEDSTKTSPRNTASKKEMTFAYKSATLGSSSILVTRISPKGANILRDEFYSGWFQPLPSSAFAIPDKSKSRPVGNYTMTITVKEVNPYGLSSQKVASFLASSAADLESIIKQLLPGSK